MKKDNKVDLMEKAKNLIMLNLSDEMLLLLCVKFSHFI